MNNLNQGAEASQLRREIERQTVKVLNSEVSGVDDDSVEAVDALLAEIDTRIVLVYLLKSRQAHGWIRDDDKAVLCACDGECGHKKAGA
jgi:hypothetical protein